MIELRILPNEVGVGTNNETGNASITALDRQANILVSIELSPDAWKAFLEAAPRVRGVGIPISGRLPLIVPDGNGN